MDVCHGNLSYAPLCVGQSHKISIKYLKVCVSIWENVKKRIIYFMKSKKCISWNTYTMNNLDASDKWTIIHISIINTIQPVKPEPCSYFESWYSLADYTVPTSVGCDSSESEEGRPWISLSYTLDIGQRINHRFKLSFIEIHYPSYQGS